MAILKDKVGLTNEDLRKLRSMRPGMPLDLQVTSGKSTKRVRTEFVGMDVGRSLIIKFPDENKWGNLHDSIYPDNTMILRYILEDETGEIIAFKVKVMLVLNKVGNLLFTSFPLAIQSHGLRAEKRAQIRLAMAVSDLQSKTELATGLVVDISNHGCRLCIKRTQMKDLIASKDNIIVSLKTPSGESIQLEGVVMNAKQDSGDVFYGVKFNASEEQVESLLASLMIIY